MDKDVNKKQQGLIVYYILKIFIGKVKEIKRLTFVVAILFALDYVLITLG